MSYLTIIPRVRVGYEVVDSQRGAVGYNHLISKQQARGQVVLLKTPMKHREFFPTLFVKNNRLSARS